MQTVWHKILKNTKIDGKISEFIAQVKDKGLKIKDIFRRASKTDARSREYKLKNHSQTKELLLKQLKNSINMALSSNG